MRNLFANRDAAAGPIDRIDTERGLFVTLGQPVKQFESGIGDLARVDAGDRIPAGVE